MEVLSRGDSQSPQLFGFCSIAARFVDRYSKQHYFGVAEGSAPPVSLLSALSKPAGCRDESKFGSGELSGDRIRVDPADLLVSGARVGWHAEDVFSSHAMADARMEGAQSGWTGLSAVALTAKAAEWKATTATLVSRLTNHAETFTTSGVEYQQTDDENAELLRDVAPGDGNIRFT